MITLFHLYQSIDFQLTLHCVPVLHIIILYIKETRQMKYTQTYLNKPTSIPLEELIQIVSLVYFSFLAGKTRCILTVTGAALPFVTSGHSKLISTVNIHHRFPITRIRTLSTVSKVTHGRLSTITFMTFCNQSH